MADTNTPKDPADEQQDPAVLHERVFKANPDGEAGDTSAPTSDAAAAFGVAPVQLEHQTPLRHIGDSDPPDFQPEGGPRR